MATTWANEGRAPTPDERNLVEVMSGYGIPHEGIALVIGCHQETLRAHFRNELDIGIVKTNTKVVGSLYKLAIEGNVAAAIYWTKARMGWSEPQRHEMSGPGGGPIETADVNTIDLARRIAWLLTSAAEAKQIEGEAEEVEASP